MVIELKRVLISDEVDPKCVQILKENGIAVDKNTKLSKEELIQEIPKYDGLIVRSATKVREDVLQAATNLKIIGRAGTGVDNIDVSMATKKGVIVMNTPGGNTLSAAELTCGMVCTLSRQIVLAAESLKAGRWDRKKFMGNELMGKTLAIVGLGRIGKEVAIRMQAFGMRTIGFDPIIPAEVSAEFGVEWMPLEKIWPQTDYVTVHTPLIPQTKNLINDDVFSKCKKGMKVINCARGGIIDEDALLRALNNGQCGGAGLDVFVEEPPKDLTLVQHPLVVCTPHLGANTVEAQSRVAEEIAQQFVDLVQGKSLFGAINAQAMTNALSQSTRPWVALGIAVGKLAGSLVGKVNNNTQVQVVTHGPLLKNAGAYLSAASLVGLLSGGASNGLNLVSAPVLAKEMGLQIATEHKELAHHSVPGLVTVVIQQQGGEINQLSGYVAGDNPVLVDINGATFNSPISLSGDVLVYRSQANSQVMPAVAGALAGSNVSVLSFATTQPINGESWSVMHLSEHLASIDVLKLHVNYAQQLTF